MGEHLYVCVCDACVQSQMRMHTHTCMEVYVNMQADPHLHALQARVCAHVRVCMQVSLMSDSNAFMEVCVCIQTDHVLFALPYV